MQTDEINAHSSQNHSNRQQCKWLRIGHGVFGADETCGPKQHKEQGNQFQKTRVCHGKQVSIAEAGRTITARELNKYLCKLCASLNKPDRIATSIRLISAQKRNQISMLLLDCLFNLLAGRTRPYPLLFVCMALTFFSAPILAVDTIESDDEIRPKIGLVLSGGGARGIAHIGVLKKLEELQIPVDYIAGTSMGSIIGALYASGKTATELEQLVLSIDWESAFTDETPRSQLPMRQKIEQNEFLIDLELGVDTSGIVIPKGVVQGQNLHLILKSIYRSALGTEDFDDLPIPFRAVASDIENGTPVVLGRGDLATAIQASMAVPGVFAPVIIDGMTLVDGGVTKNLPVDVVREMGADIVIAIDISTPLLEPEELQTALNILDQLTNILNQSNVSEQVRKLTATDFLIKPRLEGYTSASFDKVSEIVEVGSDSLEKDSSRLAQYALSSAEYSAHRIGIDQRIGSAVIPDFVTVVQNSAVSSESLRKRLSAKPAVELDQVLLHEDIERIHGLGIFQSVNYYLSDGHGIQGLIVNAKEKEWGPNYLKFGLQLEDDFEGTSNYNLALGIRREPINSLGGEFTLVVKGGTDPELSAEYFQPFNSLEDSYFLLDIENRRFSVDLFDEQNRVAEYSVRRSDASAWLGYQYNNSFDVRGGVTRSYGSALRQVGDTAFDKTADFEDGGLALELRYDTLDSVAFARQGHRGLFRYRRNMTSFGADSAYETVELRGTAVESKGQYSFILKYALAGSLDDNAPIQSLFRLGGFQNLSGFSQDSLSGQHSGLLGLGLYFPIMGGESGKFETPVYLGMGVEAGNVWQSKDDISDSSAIFAGSIFLGVNSVLGPVFLGFGQAEGGDSSFYFSLGYLY